MRRRNSYLNRRYVACGTLMRRNGACAGRWADPARTPHLASGTANAKAIRDRCNIAGLDYAERNNLFCKNRHRAGGFANHRVNL